MPLRKTRKTFLCFLLACALPALGGPFEDGKAAYQTGDYARARTLLLPLAEEGNPEAQCFLAALCLNGQGQPADREAGVKWLRRAADQGSALAWMNLGILARKDGNAKELVDCFTRAAATRPDAAALLGEAYLFGDAGLAIDPAEAARWFTRGAEAGNAGARNDLGLLYEEGKGVPQDPAKALEYYRLAAEAGDRRAEANYGRMMYAGLGVPHDYLLARTWLSLSARHGEATGEKLLREVDDKLTPEQIAETDRRAAEMDDARKKAAASP